MKSLDSVPSERVCRKRCQGETPFPIDSFYKGGIGANGVQLYQHKCKECCLKEEQARYHARPIEERRRVRDESVDAAPSNAGMKPCDIVPCGDCGYRGHVPGDEDRCLVAQRKTRSTGMGQRGMEWSL